MKRAGAPAAWIEKYTERDITFLLHPKAIKPLRLFLMLQTQWRTESLSTMSNARIIRTGLDYSAIAPTAKLAGMKVGRKTFAGLRIMEAEARDIWAEQA